jgi:subtilisin family serine protease
MSLGGSADPPLDQAVCDAIDAGVIFAIAAGNDGEDPYTQSPARVMQALTVGAMDINDDGAYFSNKGPGIDIWAPGVKVRSAKPGGGTDTMSGTSMASPHVAGGAALFLERNPGATMEDAASGLVEASSKDKLDGIGSSPNNLLYVKAE